LFIARFSLKRFFLIFLSFIVLYNLVVFYVSYKIEHRNNKDIYNSCYKIWISRGLYSTHDEQNSLKSLKKAFNAGAKGVEIDFYYDIQTDRFILSHNKPFKKPDGTLVYTLKDGKVLTLEEVFSKFAKGHWFWLDFKNLDRLDDIQTLNAIKHLQKISKIENLKSRIYIEGSTPWHLRFYKDAGFYTIMAFHPLPTNDFLCALSSNFFKILYYFYDLGGIALPYGTKDRVKYKKSAQEALKNIPTFIFHVPNDDLVLQELLDNKDVRVILVGRDESINRLDIQKCR